ncbi:MAG: hypothetical protein OEZ06_31110 [Myxococcales bacterium]|nr:hypothetical protein [Myxococcales bacterium]
MSDKPKPSHDVVIYDGERYTRVGVCYANKRGGGLTLVMQAGISISCAGGAKVRILPRDEAPE